MPEMVNIPGMGTVDLSRLRSAPGRPWPYWGGGAGSPDLYENGKRLIILGMGQTTMWSAPVNDRNYDVWGCSSAYLFRPRFTRWFEVHHWYCFTHCMPAEHMEWIRNCPVPVHMLYPTGKNAIRISHEVMRDIFGGYFTCSISYMLAQAILEEYQSISLYGVDVRRNTPWEVHRASVEYLIGFARGRGIEVNIQERSHLCYTPEMYGTHDHGCDEIAESLDRYYTLLNRRGMPVYENRS